ncbi:alpha-N-acetylgalactosaminide alpha-2,6-sialyltransferase 3 isoform X5 [Peromyscus californicus insignis]|uniref:alpha-N-acetylgalactosaminide alpha-2,6-sialyltransferase 3 isoform X5 n=1 Tax=Peromyscus californicus insignis TaxID=564181 RepID=UPI0022A7293C|nr:alpha-N-acetylgalactosaminide alpha-2,6-sialyltransferase 3 isoform X5 [Peromyscus californicus insignis]
MFWKEAANFSCDPRILLKEETERKSVLVVSFIALCLLLLAMRLVNDMNFPLLLNCFGQPETKWIPLSYTFRQPLRTHYGYINVRTQEPLQLDCGHCAIVSNSGQMVGQKVGEEIDQSSCIWRMNNAPTKGFEEDVGHVTMVRVVSHTSVPLLLKNPDYFFKEASATIYVIWGPFRNMRKDGNGIVYNMLKKAVDNYPNAQIYVTTEQRMSYCDGVFKEETGKDRLILLFLIFRFLSWLPHGPHFSGNSTICWFSCLLRKNQKSEGSKITNRSILADIQH